MSVPSTATLHYPHHPHQSPPYGYLNAIPQHTSLYYRSNSGTQQPQPSYQPQSQRYSTEMRPSGSVASSAAPTPSVTGKRRRKQTPDWKEFYKNGVPKEIIVIDDTPPPEPTPKRNARTNVTASRVPRPISQNASLNARVHNPVSSQASTATTSQPSKRRKIAANGTTTAAINRYETNHDPYASTPYSVTQTPAYASQGSSANTASASSRGYNNGTETAATSLASTIGDSASIAGTKRKRVTRGSMAKKQTDAFAHYQPPPHPPIKAKEVVVRKVEDNPKTNQKVDDDEGHYIVTPGAYLTNRYRIIKLLGQGTFGKVVQAFDSQKNEYCAIKIIRSVQKYRDASKIELRVLSTLGKNDSDNRNKCIHLRDCFDYRNHICIVTDLLGMSVFDFLKSNSFTPFPSSQIQSFARQLFTSVAFLHDLNLIHTDLKPENILLMHNTSETFTYNRVIPSSTHSNPRKAQTRKILLDTDIRLIDFGSATFDDEYHSSVVSTRHYRAPEIILGLGWSFPCDIWSIGCILVEFYTGDALFQTHDNLEHLAMMRTVCNADIETRLVRQAITKTQNSNSPASRFFRNNRLDYPNTETTKTSRRYVKAMRRLDEMIPQTCSFYRQLLDLLKKIFVYDPAKRISARDALKHPWFNEVIRDEGITVAQMRIDRGVEMERELRRRREGNSDTEPEDDETEAEGEDE
ncbi:dual specificity protein kinase kns1 [Orbilia oligospora]|uniref:dual-specificity kinase n=1 Tax=Orbilia oligospora TaxID=2813651 RepID=A0A7C8P823_ORBOL|nr:dual specificity protein kinase kns1 [Orbilia oligospora]KAF3185210.1 dual specificity protein kinase kns1 [Orbilia oligospora]KAF3244895.1 dual specificity protein kinase kns1 [Orbilia oligospora]KAF3253866.1 dual specificity protein kinase kns1 [Orbilia oligospora]KAF3293947.1 dual specificity protein kinase kns1 [Orbilia oligospora]